MKEQYCFKDKDGKNFTLRVINNETGKYGLANDDTKMVVPPVWDEIIPSFDRCILVKQESKWGLLSIDGKNLLPPIYDGIYEMSDWKNLSKPMYLIRNIINGKEISGIYSLEREEIILPPNYYIITMSPKLKDIIIVFKINPFYGFKIDLNGEKVYNGFTTSHIEINEHGGSEEVEEFHVIPEHIRIQDTEWYKKQADGLVYKDDVLIDFKGSTSDITHLTIKDGTRVILESACDFLNHAEIDIPDSVEQIGKDAFKRVPNIVYHGEASGAPWGAKCVNGCIDGDYVFSDNTKYKVVGYFGSETSISLPNGVREIGDNAFYLGRIQSVDIPNTVERIGSHAFSYCTDLRVITIPNGINKIEDGTFKGCELLEKVVFPETIKEIGDSAFSNCSSLHGISIPNGVTKIGFGAFGGCKSLKKIKIPETVEEIGGGAFKDCESLRSISIPTGSKMNRCSFKGCKSLESVVLPETVEFDLFGPFTDCQSLRSIKIPNSIKRNANDFFKGCISLETVDIPDRTNIGWKWDFTDCPNLKCINIHHVPDGGDIRNNITCNNKVAICQENNTNITQIN